MSDSPKPVTKTKAVMVPIGTAAVNFLCITITSLPLDHGNWLYMLANSQSWRDALNMLTLSWLAYDKYSSNNKYQV